MKQILVKKKLKSCGCRGRGNLFNENRRTLIIFAKVLFFLDGSFQITDRTFYDTTLKLLNISEFIKVSTINKPLVILGCDIITSPNHQRIMDILFPRNLIFLLVFCEL